MTLLSRRLVMLALALAALPVAAQASEPKVVSWGELGQKLPAMGNPFTELTEDQLDGLRTILRAEAMVDDARALALAARVRADLTEQGLDVDALFARRNAIIEERQAAASAVNEAVIGTNVRMAGYVLPLQFEDRKAVEFLLVPTVGACIHTPAPNPNQIIHVVYPQGIEVVGMFTPVWVTGTMTAQSSVQDVGYSDGRAAVAVSYAMRPLLVEKYKR